MPATLSCPRRTLSVLTAAALTAALGLAVCGTAEAAGAPTPAWDPDTWGAITLPAPTVDAELTVASISNGDATATEAVSFTRTGTAVSYDTRASAKHLQWSPGGDVLAVRPTGFSTTTLNSPNPPLDTLQVGNEPLWSPFGESTVGVSTQVGAAPYDQRAQWIGRNVADALTPGAAADSGAAAPTPSGDALVVTVGSAGARDLSVVEAGAPGGAFLPRIANKALLPAVTGGTPMGYDSLDAHDPVVGPDGTLAFVGTTVTGPAIFVDEGSGPVAVAQLVGDCPGQRPAFAPSGGSLAYLASSSDCSSSTLRVLDRAAGTFVGGPDALVTTSPAGDHPRHFASVSWRAKTPAADNRRLGGSDRVATGVQVSRFGWTRGSMGAVIASSESFPDALVAGPLAGAAGLPLLINPKGRLDARVLAELKRLMPDPNMRFVYVVGGTGVVSRSVESALGSNGFDVSRLAGADRFATSVAVAKELDLGFQGSGLPRSTAFLADGMTFPDALAAGPAASAFFAPTLLTHGRSVPASVKSYLAGRTAINRINGVGGNAAAAAGTFGGRAGDRLVGADRYDTSALVARQYFPGAWAVGYASGTSFPDALTGGALMANLWEPLMLVQQGAAPSTVATQAYRFRAATDQVLTFGGAAVVGESVRAVVAARAGTQTALYGPTTPQVDNPRIAAAQSPFRQSGPTARSRAPQSTTGKDRSTFRTATER